MARQPHHSDSAFGMIDEAELAAGDAAAGVAQEGKEPTQQPAEITPSHQADASYDAETARLAQEHDAAQENEREHENEYE